MENTNKTEGKTSTDGVGLTETQNEWQGFVCEECGKHYKTHGYANDLKVCWDCHDSKRKNAKTTGKEEW